jgi:hypothetical protein
LARLPFRYTDKNVRNVVFALLLTILTANFALGDETSFNRIKVPDAKGRESKAVLTFSDQEKAIEIRPAKRAPLNIPYSEIDKFAYEFTKQHRVNQGTIATAPVGVGAVVMLTKSKSHWLEIDYHEQEMPRTYVLRMDKHDYLRILDAVKKHTGKEAEILGNADKRHK